MARLTIGNLGAPDLSSSAQILKTSQDQFQAALSGASDILSKYDAGRQAKVDAKLTAEIAKLQDASQVGAFLDSQDISGSSPAMQEKILGLRTSLLDNSFTESKIAGNNATTGLTQARTAGEISDTGLDSLRGSAIQAGIGQTLANTSNIQGKTATDDINRASLPRRNELEMADLAAQTSGRQAKSALTAQDTLLRAAQTAEAGVTAENAQKVIDEKLLTSAAGRDSIASQIDLRGIQGKGIEVDTETAQSALDYLPTERRIAEQAAAAALIGQQVRNEGGRIGNLGAGIANKAAEKELSFADQNQDIKVNAANADILNTESQIAKRALDGKRVEADTASVAFNDALTQARTQQVGANTARTQGETVIARNAEARSQTRFLNGQTDRIIAQQEKAEEKQNKRLRDTAVLEAIKNPNLVTEAERVDVLLAKGVFNDPSEAIKALYRAKEVAGGVASSFASPDVAADPTIQTQLQLVEQETQTKLDNLPQARLVQQSRLYNGDRPEADLVQELGIDPMLFDSPEESMNKVRMSIDRIAKEAGVSRAIATAALREGFKDGDPFLALNTQEAVFDFDYAIDYAKAYGSPNSVRDYREKEIRYSNELKSLTSKAAENTKARKKIAKGSTSQAVQKKAADSLKEILQYRPQ